MELVTFYGSVNYADKSNDRITSKAEKSLPQTEKKTHNVTSQSDPILLELAKKVHGPVVITTDTILAALMCCTRSFYSWDMVITKKGNQLFLDKRNGGPLDYLTVNENATETPIDSGDKDNKDINSPQSLAYEATHVNRHFRQSAIKEGEQVVFKNANPFSAGETADSLASGAYRYRKWDLNGMDLICRTKIDAAIQIPGSKTDMPDIESSTLNLNETAFANIYALNEFDSRAHGAGNAPDWRQKIDAQRGAVLGSELKNNSNRLSRWTTECLLAGVDQMRFGFLSRVAPKDRKKHVLLGMAIYKPTDFAAQMALNVQNGWGIAKAIFDLCFKLGDGKYVLMKDPNKAQMRFYKASAAVDVEVIGEAVAVIALDE